MAASGEILYTFRTKFPDILQINRDNTVKMEMRRDGAIVLWVHSEIDVQVQRLEIVGTLTGAAEGGREAWIASRLAGMGL